MRRSHGVVLLMNASCVLEDPEGAISEGEEKYVIDPKLCNDCGNCAEQCPVEAIVPGDEK